MIDPMDAEFDSVAGWTADVAADFGPEYYLPAGCRGSGSPAVLRWFIDQLALDAGDRMLDCGAGVGGPAAFAANEVGIRPVLTDPEEGACRAASRLFGLPVVQAASDLPFRGETFDVAWCLGVLCTVDDQSRLLRELRRVLRPTGRLGLLVYAARSLPLAKQPAGNNFPTPAILDALLDEAGLVVDVMQTTVELAGPPAAWQERADAVDAELARRHANDPAWRTAAQQSTLFGELLQSGQLVGMAVSCGLR